MTSKKFAPAPVAAEDEGRRDKLCRQQNTGAARIAQGLVPLGVIADMILSGLGDSEAHR